MVGVRRSSTPGTPVPPSARRPRPALARSLDDRLVAGVCGGLGARLGVDPVVLRLALLALTFAGGFGVLAYVVLWALAEDRVSDEASPGPRSTTAQQAASVALVTFGLLLLLREAGLWFGDGIVWPVALAALGSGLLWARDDDSRMLGLRRSGGSDAAEAPPFAGSLGEAIAQAGPVRIVVGAVLLGAGMVAFLAANDRLTALGDVALAVLVGLAGIVLVFGPWLSRLLGQLGDERRERIRTEERAALAAHLHDSVLQTLALIQRTADQPARTVALARRQERELRAWLYGGAGRGTGGEPTTFGQAMARLATDVEDEHAVRVEAVVVGDGPMQPTDRPLVAAVREAVLNAARHAGIPTVDVYVEAGPGEVVATVRDRGAGFSPDEVADDRHGIRHSIRGRLARAGGSAELSTSPGDGTEWELRLPRPGRRRTGPERPDADRRDATPVGEEPPEPAGDAPVDADVEA